jgi:hypothetical protein
MVNGPEIAVAPHPGNQSPSMVIDAKGIHFIPILKAQSLHGNQYKTMISNGDFLISSKTLRIAPTIYYFTNFLVFKLLTHPESELLPKTSVPSAKIVRHQPCSINSC